MANDTQITVVGSLTGDPELRFLPSGVAVASFTVAVNRRSFNKQANEWKDEAATFWKCTAWRDYAEHVASTLTKGMHTIVLGTIREETWEDKNGGGQRSRTVLDVVEAGPALRFQEAQVRKAAQQGNTNSGFGGHTQQSSQPAAPAQDAWGQQGAAPGWGDTPQAPGGWGQAAQDSPPF